MAKNIKGVVIEISGDSSQITKSLSEADKALKKTNEALKAVDKALQLDPKSTELVTQKQELLAKAVGITEDRLDSMKQAAELAAQGLEEGTVSREQYARLAAEIKIAEHGLEELKSQADASGNALEDISDAASETGDSFEDAADSTEETSEALEEVADSADEAGDEAKEAGEQAEAGGKGWSVFGAMAQGAAQAITTYVLDAIAEASEALVDFASDAVETGMAFDSSMSQVAATMGTTVDEVQDLRDFALEMGSTTAFSATQAADALNYMALAGYDAETSMEMLPNVLNLAAAGGIDLATASDMVTDVSSALGLSIEETSAMIDQMASASSITNTSVAQLGEALLTLGATGANVAGGTNELATILGVLADNGIKGSEGGTHLRNIILSLTQPTSAAAEALEELGISAYNSEGEMRPLTDVLGDIQDVTAEMSQETADDLIGTLFNRSDMAAANALLNTSVERFSDLTVAIDSADGAASAMADTQLDNLAGDITLFQSALEGAQITLSDALTPTLREFVQFGADGISQITQAFNEDGLEGALSTFGEILDQLIPQIQSAIETGLPVLMTVGGSILGTIADSITANLDSILETGLNLVLRLATGIIESLPRLVPVALNLVMKLASFLVENLPAILQAGIDLILGLAQAIGSSAPELIPMVVRCINQIVTTLLDNIDDILLAGMQLLIGLGLGIVAAIPDMLAFFPEVFTAIQDTITEFFEGLWESASTWGADMIANFISGITSGFGNLTSAVSNAASIVADFLHFSVPSKGPLRDFDETMGEDMIDNFVRGIQNEMGSLEAVLNVTGATIAAGMQPQPDYTGALQGIQSSLAGFGNTPIQVVVQVGGETLDSYMVNAQTVNDYRSGGF